MPYYKTVDETSVPSILLNGTQYHLQTSMFEERIGWRSRAPKRGKVTQLDERTVAPYTWFETYEDLKERNAVSSHPELVSLFKKDKGHAWDVVSCDFLGTPWTYDLFYKSSLYHTSPLCRPFPTAQTGIISPLSLDSSPTTILSSYAALEYGRSAPTSDQISMSAIIGELREGLPALIPLLLTTGSKRDFKYTLQRQTRRARDAGSDYLNVQFGWIPLLADVRKVATALAVATAAMTGDNLLTHRRRDKPETDTTVQSSSVGVNRAYRHSSASFEGSGTGASSSPSGLVFNRWLVQHRKVHYSFEAEFVRLPEGQRDYSSYIDKLNELMRWDITPMDLWQLAPWSWLVDWFFDIGAQLDAWNSTTSNRILSLYAYGMREESLETTLILSDIRGQSADYRYVGPKTVFTQYQAKHRQRIKANPFGFIPDPLSQLSAGQLAILGALGLTKIRR